MIKSLLTVLLFASLVGCSAGQSTYTVRPFFLGPSQTLVCCEVTVKSSRNVQSVHVQATKVGNDYNLNLTETGVSASEPIKAQAAEVGSVSNAVGNAAAAAVKLIP